MDNLSTKQTGRQAGSLYCLLQWNEYYYHSRWKPETDFTISNCVVSFFRFQAHRNWSWLSLSLSTVCKLVKNLEMHFTWILDTWLSCMNPFSLIYTHPNPIIYMLMSSLSLSLNLSFFKIHYVKFILSFVIIHSAFAPYCSHDIPLCAMISHCVPNGTYIIKNTTQQHSKWKNGVFGSKLNYYCFTLPGMKRNWNEKYNHLDGCHAFCRFPFHEWIPRQYHRKRQ